MSLVPKRKDPRVGLSDLAASLREAPPLGVKQKAFLLVLCILAGAPVLKLGEIQILELILLLHFVLILVMFVYRGLRFRTTAIWRTYGIPNAAFLFAAGLLAVFALRLPFFPIASEPSLLKQPLFLSLSRLTEYLLVSFYMVYVADMLQEHRHALVFALKAYVYTGICSSLYGLFSWPLLLAAGIELGAYNPNQRIRGFMNEGGPYGVYLVGVAACACLLARLQAPRRSYFFALSVVAILPALILSQSKAAATAIVLILALLVLLEKSFWAKALIIAALASVILVVVVNRRSLNSYAGYFATAVDDNLAQAEDAKDEGFGGRAGSFVFLPRMIAAHPIAGIGLGNYPLMRNDPEYLQGFTPVDHWDLPGSGLVSYAAELGIPLFVLLLVIVFLPLLKAIQRHAPKTIVVLAAVQPVSLLCGTQVNFFYPWLCSSFAIAALATLPTRRGGQ